MARRYHLCRPLPPTAARDRGVCVVRVVLARARVSIVLAAQRAAHPLVWLALSVLSGAVIVRLSTVELAAMLVVAAIYAR